MSSRQQLSQREIDQVLSNYALGTVHSVAELAAGSVYSPKVIIESDRGRFLLKRRARGLDLPAVVAFSHEVILGCLELGVCVPPLVGTSANNNSMVQFEDQVYELFVYIQGQPFDRSPAMIDAHAQQAGALLGEVHRALDAIRTTFEPAVEPTTIDLGRVELIDQLGANIDTHQRDHLRRLMEFGSELAQANAQRPSLVHGDWHPGNMIYRGPEIVAVCDFDNSRMGSRLREVAQAMVHFSLKPPAPGQSAQRCDPDPDLGALASFWKGYCSDNASACPLKLSLGLMPAVMIDEALASIPAHAPASPRAHAQRATSESSDAMLIAIARKAIWLDEHQGELVLAIESARCQG